MILVASLLNWTVNPAAEAGYIKKHFGYFNMWIIQFLLFFSQKCPMKHGLNIFYSPEISPNLVFLILNLYICDPLFFSSWSFY